MRSTSMAARLAAVCGAGALILLAAPAAHAQGQAAVRFVNAAAGAGAVTVTATSGGAPIELGAEVGFGESTDYRQVGLGSVEIALSAGGRPVASASLDLDQPARYTAVALGDPGRPELRLYRDGAPAAGRGRLRVIHAAPELGSPEIRLGGRAIASRLGFGDATPYRSVEPGTRELSAARPTGDGEALVSQDAAVPAGTASTAVLLGTRGERARFLLLADGAVTPSGAPATGLGGLSQHGPRWPWVLGAALLGAALGGAGYRLATAGRGGGARVR